MLDNVDLGSTFWQPRLPPPQSTFGNQKWPTRSTFGCQKWTGGGPLFDTGGPLLAAKSGPGGPLLVAKSGPGGPVLTRATFSMTDPSLVPRPPSEKSRKGLVTRTAMPRPRGIQSVTKSRVNFYTRGDNWSCAPLNSCMYVRHCTKPFYATTLRAESCTVQNSRITTGSPQY